VRSCSSLFSGLRPHPRNIGNKTWHPQNETHGCQLLGAFAPSRGPMFGRNTQNLLASHPGTPDRQPPSPFREFSPAAPPWLPRLRGLCNRQCLLPRRALPVAPSLRILVAPRIHAMRTTRRTSRRATLLKLEYSSRQWSAALSLLETRIPAESRRIRRLVV